MAIDLIRPTTKHTTSQPSQGFLRGIQAYLMPRIASIHDIALLIVIVTFLVLASVGLGHLLGGSLLAYLFAGIIVVFNSIFLVHTFLLQGPDAL
jgi:hypothetical protein